jgi:hypothetical protein
MHMLSICCFIIVIFQTFSILPQFSIGLWVQIWKMYENLIEGAFQY